MIDLDYLRDQIAGWRFVNFGPGVGTGALGKCTEEVGELWVAHCKLLECDSERASIEQRDAVGDVLIALLGYCAEQNLSMEECLRTAWAEVRDRDYVKYPGRGRP